MSKRLIIVSNRLPYSFTEHYTEDERISYDFKQSTGGLVSGLKPLMKTYNTTWIGWADTQGVCLDKVHKRELTRELDERNCVPVFIDDEHATQYYDGFSNSTIWPLFHHFSQHSQFDDISWKSYVMVNEQFCSTLIELVEPGDTIWIHDYHLMLLPQMLREKTNDIAIGFFLHIPFPSYETFRILPHRKELLTGVLGADLVGFHTYDYARHFLSSCRRLINLENRNGSFALDGRSIQVDAFPLGIDYELYRSTAQEDWIKTMGEEFTSNKTDNGKVILSVERLDYTKGILDSLKAFDMFLCEFPEWQGRVILALVVVPSRESVDSYADLKRQIDEYVGYINGKYSTVSWSPIDYYYRSFGFEQLCGFYAASDVMLVTPLRDGMNLVAKEYLASHDEDKGVLILSEMAGSAYELSDAIIINPYNQEEYIAAIESALTMPEDEQIRRNSVMQERLKRYTSETWAKEFMSSLEKIRNQQKAMDTHILNKMLVISLAVEYKKAQERAILLDYDGTLVSFKENPSDAYPDNELLELLKTLTDDEHNHVVIISGRNRHTLECWFKDLPIDLIAEHGMWLYSNSADKWTLSEPQDNDWKEGMHSVLEDYVMRSPGSFIEEKDFSLVWHCRGCSEELATRRMSEIKTTLWEEAESKGLALLEGNKVIEIKPKNVDKGRAAHSWLRDKTCHFTLAAGDDRTDEDIFRSLSEDAWTIKVGMAPTAARYYVRNSCDVRALLQKLTC